MRDAERETSVLLLWPELVFIQFYIISHQCEKIFKGLLHLSGSSRVACVLFFIPVIDDSDDCRLLPDSDGQTPGEQL